VGAVVERPQLRDILRARSRPAHAGGDADRRNQARGHRAHVVAGAERLEEDGGDHSRPAAGGKLLHGASVPLALPASV
jgi:hypothetical protein